MGLQSRSLRKFYSTQKTKPAAAKFTLFDSGKFKRLVSVDNKAGELFVLFCSICD